MDPLATATKQRISKAKMGTPAWNKGQEYHQIRGEKHPNWRGGVTPLYEKIRKSLKYKIWRNAVFKRDNYTCKNCGMIKCGIEADHIKPFALFTKLRFKIGNGRTLCKKCH